MTLSSLDLIVPEWPAPANVMAIQTTRTGGVSRVPYSSFNLGAHVGDDAVRVARNRQMLSAVLPSEPVWLRQVHGVEVVNAASTSCEPVADAAYTRIPHTVCTVMTADCLPILLCDRQGSVVAAAHAGWRGLCDGVIEATVRAMAITPDQLMAWLGPAIGPESFEVGAEVRAAFIAAQPIAALAFTPHATDKWLAYLYQLARQRLEAAGVNAIYGGGINSHFCTYREESRFFSYRRDGTTGRMASLIWIT